MWKQVSEDCQAFISQLLKYDAEDRPSASEALKSPWIRSLSENSIISDVELRLSLNNLRNYRNQMLFQKAVLTYIASRQLPQKAEKKIRKLFDFYDTDGDGQISKRELVAGCKLLYGNTRNASKDAERILSHITLNKNGNIGYNGEAGVRKA